MQKITKIFNLCFIITIFSIKGKQRESVEEKRKNTLNV